VLYKDAMNENPNHAETSEASSYEPPTVETISLDCEISSYAPDDGDTPLF
jgi:hypothetical protein